MNPLPGMPEPPPAPARKAPPGARVSRYRNTTRRMCDLCIEDIHYRGVGDAPYPQPARWHRVTAQLSQYLCERHKEAST